MNIDGKILRNTLVGIESLKNIAQLSDSVKASNGCIAEVGVYRGGSALLLCRLNPESEVYLFDTFEGLPKTHSSDNTHKKGDFDDVSEQHVRGLLGEYGNCRIYRGNFPADTGDYVRYKKFKLVHLDVDIYQSYRDCLEFFYPRLVGNGIIIMDDYGSEYCLGAKKAVDDFMRDQPEELITGPERQAHFVKGAQST